MNTLMSFTQYLKDTRAEMRHVAWPTQAQTIVYTLLVAGISVGTALYLGLFDFLFTSGVKKAVERIPATPSLQVEQMPVIDATATPASTSTPVSF